MTKLTVPLLTSFLIFTSFPALAHSPYAKAFSIISAPTGKPLIVEQYFGDGVLAPDPVQVHIRNKNGAIIAATPAERQASIDCPTVSACFVTLYNPSSRTAQTWQLIAKDIAYETATSHDFTEEEKIEFAKYLSGTIKQFRGSPEAYPKAGQGKPFNFIQVSDPFRSARALYSVYLITFLAYTALVGIGWMTRTSKLLLIGALPLLSIALLVQAMMNGTSILLMISMMALGLLVGDFLAEKAKDLHVKEP